MCGIAGVVGPTDDEDWGFEVRAMANAIAHRGPDDDGFLDEAGCHLGMRRLAIIDVAHGAQPISSEDGAVVTVFNGEIYNYHDIQVGLRARGHRLETDSDTETLVHLYEDYGADMVGHLRGMFGIAIWDRASRTLFLARDRAGKKPLYYFQDGPRLWFASELKSLMSVYRIPRQVDPSAIHHYLTYQYVPHPWSALAGVKKLPPAHYLIWRDGSLSVKRYWQLTYPDAGLPAPRPEVDLAGELRDQLLEATRIRMISERPLGAFLSGGLDSSAVVAAMAKTSDAPVTTFSIGFEEEEYNELPYARRVAELYGTDHHELIVRPDVEDLLPRLVRQFDEPFADSSAIPSFYVAEMARRHVVVALNGDGGDEALGGYQKYAHFMRMLPEHRLPAAFAALGRHAGNWSSRHPSRSRTVTRVGIAGQRLGESDPCSRYGRMVSYFFPEEKASLYRPEFAEQIAADDSYALGVPIWEANRHTDPVNRLLAMDVDLYLPGDLLPKVDITTMAVSLEARSPFLDHVFMEWAASLPGALKVRRGVTKYLMKQALEPWLPQDLIHRPKRGFGIPRNEWISGPLRPMVHDLLLQSDSRIDRYFRPDGVARLVDEQERFGGRGEKVWALLMLELWHREVLEA